MRPISERLHILLLIFIGLIVWGNSLLNPLFISDDEDQIINHKLIRNITNIPQLFTGSTYYREENSTIYGLYFRPIMLTVYTILYQINGPDPLIFHMSSLLFHIINAILFYIFFKTVFSKNISFILGLIFLVHPIVSEVVLHAANLQDGLYVFFGLLSLLNLKNNTGLRLTIVNFILILLALLSKESGIVFAVIGFIYLLIFNNKLIKSIMLSSIFAFILYFILRFYIAGLGISNNDSIAIISKLPIWERLLSAPFIIFNYFLTLIMPLNISISHYWVLRGVTLSKFIIPLIIIVIVLFFLNKLFFQKWKNDLLRKYYLFFIIWFLLGIIPYLHIIPLDVTYAERWFYFSFIGFLGIIGSIYEKYKYKFTKINLYFCYIIFAIIIALSVRSFARTFDWRDSLTLLLRDSNKSQDNYYLENLLATIYIREGNFKEAKKYLEKSISTYPYVGSYSNMGIVSYKEGNNNLALEYFKKARYDRKFFDAHRNYINFLYYIINDVDTTLIEVEKSLAEYPTSGDLLLVKAQALYKKGNQNEAIGTVKKALSYTDTVMAKEIYLSILGKKDIDISRFLSY